MYTEFCFFVRSPQRAKGPRAGQALPLRRQSQTRIVGATLGSPARLPRVASLIAHLSGKSSAPSSRSRLPQSIALSTAPAPSGNETITITSFAPAKTSRRFACRSRKTPHSGKTTAKIPASSIPCHTHSNPGLLHRAVFRRRLLAAPARLTFWSTACPEGSRRAVPFADSGKAGTRRRLAPAQTMPTRWLALEGALACCARATLRVAYVRYCRPDNSPLVL